MKQRGQFEAESADFLLRFLPSRNGKYLCGQFAGKKINRHLQMMVTSAISMVLCCTMFLGTTMAWFTDSVITAGNKIIIGELSVDLMFGDKSLNPEKYKNILENPPDVFGANIKWEPGLFETRKLTVVNTGNLPIKYELKLLPSDPVIAQYFDVYIPATPSDEKTETVGEPESAAEMQWHCLGSLSEVNTVQAGSIDAAENGQSPRTSDILIGLKMKDNIDTSKINELFGRDFTLYFNLFAYQDTANSNDIKAIDEANQDAAMTDIIEKQKEIDAAKKEAEEASQSFKLTKPSNSTTSSNTSTETGGNNQTQSDDDNQTQNGDDNQTQNGDDNQTQTGDNNQTQTGDDNQTQNGDDNQTQTGDDNQTQTGDDNQTQTGDDNQTQTSSDNESQTGSDNAPGTDAQNLEDPDSEAGTTETTSKNVVSEGETPENE